MDGLNEEMEAILKDLSQEDALQVNSLLDKIRTIEQVPEVTHTENPITG